MSFITDHVSRLDGQLDRLQLAKQPSVPSSPELHSVSDEAAPLNLSTADEASDLIRIHKLGIAINALSTAASAHHTPSSATVVSILAAADLLQTKSNNEENVNPSSVQEQELEWLVVGKAATQTYGIILSTLLNQTIPLSSEIGYWNEILGSYRNLGWYTVQTSPLHLWRWVSDIYKDAWQRFQSIQTAKVDQEESSSISQHWRRFYGLVQESIKDRSLADMQSKVLSPLTRSRMEAKSKRSGLKRLREMSASGLGMLMDEGLVFDADDEGSVNPKSQSSSKDEWRSVVSKSISLMEIVLRNITVLELGTNELEDIIFQNVEDDTEPIQEEVVSSRTEQLAKRLKHILNERIPAHVLATTNLSNEYGRPSRFIRYWLPGLVLALSSTTLLRIFVKRKAEIVTWIRDFGATTLDFWNNWVVEPVRKVIGTIRHDEDSEITIMSKESLRGDRESLERMVVDFATDNANTSTGASLTDVDIADVRAKVKEGDLTPVLRAYEKDLRRPFVGTVRGDLIRALLIQIQKTKVDVEVAVGGIDNLLKSQELVFGFVGLTPGVLVCLGLSHWISSVFTGRRGVAQNSKQDSMIRILRNVDRILIGSIPSGNGVLSYKDHGMLLCEVHRLRRQAKKSLPGDINNEFLEEIHDLIDLRTGVKRQMHTVERIRWAYSKWLQ